MSTLSDISTPQGNRVSGRVKITGQTITAVTGEVRPRRIDLTDPPDEDPVADWVWTEGDDGWWDGYVDTDEVPVGTYWYDWVVTTDEAEVPHRLPAARLVVNGVVDA